MNSPNPALAEPIPVNIAIDLESLDKRPSAIVLSIGMAAFTIPGGLVGTYYAELNQGDQKQRGRTIDRGTIAWWNQQPEEAQRILTGLNSIDTIAALDGAAAFVNRFNGGHYQIAGVWGYGSDFDNAMLQDLYRDFGHPVPWSYKLNRCGRTITNLAKQTGMEKPPNNGTHHNALDDAVWQAEYIRLSHLRLGLR